MIVHLMTYAFRTSLLIGLAALAVEPILADPGWPRRGIWVFSLVVSVALPAAAVLIPRDAPRYVSTPGPRILAPTRERTRHDADRSLATVRGMLLG